MGSCKIKIKNKPVCIFCGNILIAESVNVTRNINSYYITGKSKSVLVPNSQDIELSLRCPSCGSVAKGIGDHFQYSVRNSSHEVVINNVIVQCQSGPDLNTTPAKALERKKFNPSRRDNHVN